MIATLIPAAIGAGLSCDVVGFLLRARDRASAMDDLMSLARYGEGEFDDDIAAQEAAANEFALSGFGSAAV